MICSIDRLIIIARMTMCASIFLLIASAVERYLAVCRPHHYRQVHLGSIEIEAKSNLYKFQIKKVHWRELFYIFPSVGLAFLMNITR
jgi:hypothetical protein